MILPLSPYTTTDAMVGEVGFRHGGDKGALVQGPGEMFFPRYQFHARHGIDEVRTGSCVLGLLAGNESAKRYLLDTL